MILAEWSDQSQFVDRSARQTSPIMEGKDSASGEDAACSWK